MTLRLTIYDNGDHTCLVWMPDDGARIDGCLGFVIERTLNDAPDYVHGWVGFSPDDVLNPNAPWNFPIQRFMWWDYKVKPGDRVRYAVVPVRKMQGKVAPDRTNRSAPSPELTVSGNASPHLSAYFNRGIVATQWVSRAMAAQPARAKLKDLVADPANDLRRELGGNLRPKLLELLAKAKADGDVIYAALYELNDPELVDALVALGEAQCNLILGNGAFKGNEPPDNDENAGIRAQIKPKVTLHDRIVRLGHFAHNKFIVFCRADGQPHTVLTGSTNWTSSGLCTQANNALVIEDAAVARHFKAAWDRIQAAGDDYTKQLVDGNSVAQTFPVDGCKITPWFAATSKEPELVQARELIENARDGILFLFFNPGTFQTDAARKTLLQTIVERRARQGEAGQPSMYFCGVVNQNIAHLTTDNPEPSDAATALSDPSAPPPVTLFDSSARAPKLLGHDVLVPHAIKADYAKWVKEMLGASMVNVHSKVIVLDPFGDKPVVMTGSHNLGLKASSANDDNLVIIEGNGALAAAYAVNIVAIFQNYRWNDYVTRHAKDSKAWHGLRSDDTWQDGYLAGGDLEELRFWTHDRGDAPPAAATRV